MTKASSPPTTPERPKPSGDEFANEKAPAPLDPSRLVSVDDTIDAIAKEALEKARVREERDRARKPAK